MDYTDSRGLFSCRVPADFLRSERKNDKTGFLFVAGDFNKAEVLSVQVISASDLLLDAGESKSDLKLVPNATELVTLRRCQPGMKWHSCVRVMCTRCVSTYSFELSWCGLVIHSKMH